MTGLFIKNMSNIKKLFDKFCYILIDDNKIITKISITENENTFKFETYIKNTLTLKNNKLVTYEEICALLEQHKIISLVDKNNLTHRYDTFTESFVY